MGVTLDMLTFGCRLNAFESEVMRAHASAAGINDAIIVNSCAVTSEAERQARQAIRRARREHPEKRIIVTGCAAQIHAAEFAAMPEVDHVIGNEEKMQAEEWVRIRELTTIPSPRPSPGGRESESADRALSLEAPSILSLPMGEGLLPSDAKIRVNDILSVKQTALHMVQGFDKQTRAFVQVQNGCDHRCTFCIIPFGRGNSRSVPMGEIVAQVRALVEQGYKEVVFTGVDISDYGHGLPGSPTLGALVRRVLKAVPELPRLRLSSIDAVEVDEELYRAIAEEERLMPHLHISLQAGDDMILKRMKRRHSRKDALDFCGKVRGLRSDVVFGADLIAGFPTESDAMFENSLALIEEANLTWLHVFPYSERPGTPAARMPQVPKALRKERAARLREAGGRQAKKFLDAQVGRTAQVLVEQDGMGRTEHFAPVMMRGNPNAGTLIASQLHSTDGQRLHA